MATLSGRYPANTFKGLLNIDNSNAGIDGTLRTVQDGEGTTCPLYLSSSAVNITALQVSGSAVTLGGEFTTSGAYACTLTLTGATNVTLPTSGTLYGTATGSITSAALLASMSDETGTGALVFATSPTLVTPLLGTPTSGNLSNCTAYPLAQLTGAGTGVLTALAINTGSAGAPVLFNGALGTPSSGTLSSCTGLPVSTGISGLGTGVATFLATPSSANLATAMTDETGSGALVFANTPTLVTPILGTPTSGTLTNCTGLPEAAITDGAWTSWSPAVTGFVDNNVGFTNSSYKVLGSQVFVYFAMGAGTSNATTMTITGLPYAPKYGFWAATYGLNNGGNVLAMLSLAAGSTTITCYNGANSTSWTSSGTKQIPYFYLVYEINN